MERPRRKPEPDAAAGQRADEQRERVERALLAGEIGTWTWDIRADRVRSDPSLHAMFGLPPGDDDGRPLAEYLAAIHPDDLPRVRQAIAAAIAPDGTGRIEEEYRVVVAGTERWVCARGIVERDASGAAIRLPGVVLDVGRQKRLALELRRLVETTARQARVFDTTLSAIADFAYIFDLDGRFLYVNKALLDLWGLTLDQAVGKNFFDLQYPDELAARLQRQIQQVIDTGQMLSDETPYTSPTGAGGYYEYIFSPVFAEDGSVEVVAGSTRDVSARKNAEDGLRRRTAQFETLLGNAPLGVYLVDADFRIREANPAARAMFDQVRDPIGRDFETVCRSLLPPGDADDVVRRFRHTLETGEQYVGVDDERDPRRRVSYEWQINRIPLPDGRVGVVCYFRDVSAQVAARRELEDADRQKNEFLAMLAHELRNPLAPIRNASELLSRTLPEDDPAHAAIGVVQRQVGHLTRLVDDLLDVARITQGRIELRRRPIEIAAVVAQAIEIVGPVLREKRHEVLVAPSYGPLHVNADPARLVQCVANVLTNAAKYTDPGGEIRIHPRREDDEVVLTISDNGAGIPSTLLPRLFDLFVQNERTLDRADGGLGIGLAIVKRLVEMHDGSVSASSAGSGRGATFEIRLPLIGATAEPASATAPTRVAARRVLVVDDNVDSADSLAMLLRLDGHDADAVYGAYDALERVAASAPDVVLLDIGLPEMDGYEVARRLRASGQRCPRLVALTGYGQAEDRQRALAAGFDDHLVKPVDFRALGRTLGGDPDRDA